MPFNYVYKSLENSNNKFELKIIDIGGSCDLEKIDEYCSSCTIEYIDPKTIELRTTRGNLNITQEFVMQSEMYYLIVCIKLSRNIHYNQVN